MTSRSRGSLGGIRSALAAALAILFVLTLAPHGGAQKPEEKQPKECPALDAVYSHDEGWAGGIVAEGITVTSFDHERVTFDVADGSTLVGLCVRTARENDVYSSDATLPARGPITVTLTQAAPGYVIHAVSFDTEPTPPDEDPEVTCPTVEAPDVTFGEPKLIDPNRAGGEPVSVIAQDGSINVSAHAGTTHVYKDPNAAGGAGDFLIGYWNQTLNWRSTDGGRTWSYVGLGGLHEGPHSATSTGFSDPDFAMDQAGNIYNVEIDLANVAVFKSNDDGQSYLTANPEAWFGDRPWLTALEEDEVFLYVNLPKALLKSVDGGLTWVPVLNNLGGAVPAQSPPINAKALPDPLNPDNGLIGPMGSTLRGNNAMGDPRFWIGEENDIDVDKPGAPTVTWKQYQTGPLGRTQQFFSSLAVDSVGNVYLGAAGGYTGGADTTPNGEVSFAYHERETGARNAEKLIIPTPAGDALWPWIVAGDDGRAALVWYQNLAGKPEEFYAFIAVTHNAHGTTVTCSDGHTEFIPPRFTVLNASQRPVFYGNICQDGTNCNANTSFKRGDRRLGDFFTVNFDHEGNLFIVTADTTLKSLLQGQKPVGNPVFIKQVSGDPMLEQPMEIRESRCIMNLPVC